MILLAPADVVALRSELKKAECTYFPNESTYIDGPPRECGRKSFLFTGSRPITGVDLANYMTAAKIEYCYIYHYGAKCEFDESRLLSDSGDDDFSGDSTAMKFLEGFIGPAKAEDNTFDIAVSIRTGCFYIAYGRTWTTIPEPQTLSHAKPWTAPQSQGGSRDRLYISLNLKLPNSQVHLLPLWWQ